MLFTLLSRRRVYPSAATTRVGTDNFRRGETVCTIKAKSNVTCLIAICVAPRAPKTTPMVATTKVRRDNFGGGGTVFTIKTTGGAIYGIAITVAPVAPRITPIAVTPPGGFDVTM
jgi:hypothetical protein